MSSSSSSSSSSPNEFPASFVLPWADMLYRSDSDNEFPSYYVNNFEKLIATSVPKALHVGTGLSIFTRALLPAILNAKNSVNFVTCYWANSPTLDAFNEALRSLAASRIANGYTSILTVTIGFSSRSLLQKLLHTSSRRGHVYPPSFWAKLGLPEESVLKKGGIELTVKSLFFTPISVMHPKYLIVDGNTSWIPSCNVSWESWFEGCVELEGDIVDQLMTFHRKVWGEEGTTIFTNPSKRSSSGRSSPALSSRRASLLTGGGDGSATQSLKFTGMLPVSTIFLPSTHHRNPRFSLLHFLSRSKPPKTPLNAALLTLVANAQRSINIITPNVTSWPLLNALLSALERGVDVQIRTSRDMMRLEQLVTAGTTTSWCLEKFIKKYKALHRYSDDLEEQASIGKLEILYYKPLDSRMEEEDEPVLSHFKMTMVDEEYLVLGSGNMDRASWWTSQEIGVLFHVTCFEWKRLWEGVLEKRSETLFNSEEEEEEEEEEKE